MIKSKNIRDHCYHESTINTSSATLHLSRLKLEEVVVLDHRGKTKTNLKKNCRNVVENLVDFVTIFACFRQ